MRIAKRRTAGFITLLCCVVLPVRAFELKPCFLPAAGGGTMHAAQCGTFEVAENPKLPDGRRIGLRVVRIPAAVPQFPDPLFILAGGPGQAASEIYPQIAPALERIARGRDIVLIDQRGTGGSNPLHCPTFKVDFTRPLDLNEIRRQAAECRDSLATKADLRYYTTALAMADYDAVREALGYDQINLWGGSYGTRAAQVYLRLYPERVRRVVLDSVVPPRLALGAEHALMLDRALALIFADCAKDAACAAAYPDPAADLTVLKKRWSTEPGVLQVVSPRSANAVDVRADRDVLAGVVRLLTYSGVTQSLLPQLIHRAAGGEPEILLALNLVVAERLENTVARGLEASVMCSEDFPFFPKALNQDATLIGDAQWQAIAAICAVWPVGEVAEDFHQMQKSDVPVLLLAGERDPVTPPAYAEETAAQFSHSKIIVVPGAGHLVLSTACVPKLVADFILFASGSGKGDEAASPFSGLDTDCLEKQSAEPFFTTALGTEP